MTATWTPEEHDWLRLAKHELAPSIEGPTLLLGATEAGDPWCCVLSKTTGEIVVGFGKTRAGYIIRVVPSLPGGGTRYDGLQAAVESFLVWWQGRNCA